MSGRFVRVRSARRRSRPRAIRRRCRGPAERRCLAARTAGGGHAIRSSSRARRGGWTSWAASPITRARWSCSGRFARPRASRSCPGPSGVSRSSRSGTAAPSAAATCRSIVVADAAASVRRRARVVRGRSGAALGGVCRGRVPRARARAWRALRHGAAHPDRVRRAGRKGRQLVGGDRGGDDGGGASLRGALSIEPRMRALRCQQVENLIVGAPCGIMDQMATICGEAGS